MITYWTNNVEHRTDAQTNSRRAETARHNDGKTREENRGHRTEAGDSASCQRQRSSRAPPTSPPTTTQSSLRHQNMGGRGRALKESEPLQKPNLRLSRAAKGKRIH